MLDADDQAQNKIRADQVGGSNNFCFQIIEIFVAELW
jgi:hypothetical protein